MIILRKITTQSSDTNVSVVRELSGTVDSVNKTFNTLHNYVSNRISVLFNGQSLHSPDDFLETGDNEITFVYIAPSDRDNVRVTYEISV